MNDYLLDRNGTMYIGLHNHYNHYCYYITVIQRLHSSPTLNKMLNNGLNNMIGGSSEPDADISKRIMSQLQIYSKITPENYENIYNQANENLKSVISQVFSPEMNNGGDPNAVLTYLFLPIIYHYTKNLNEFKQIIKELNVNPLHFNPLTYVNKNSFNFTKNEDFNKQLNKWYEDMFKNVIETDKDDSNISKFNITAASIYLRNAQGKQADYPGHAVNILYAKSKNDSNYDYYVIDDDANIKDLATYCANAKPSIWQIEIKDMPDEAVKMIDSKQGFKCSSVLNNCFDIAVNKRIYRTVITFNSKNNNNNMSGGVTVQKVATTEEGEAEYKVKMSTLDICLIGFIILLVISIVVFLIYTHIESKKEKEEYEEKLKKYKEKIDNKTDELKKIQEEHENLKSNVKANQETFDTPSKVESQQQQSLVTGKFDISKTSSWLQQVRKPIIRMGKCGWKDDSHENYTIPDEPSRKGSLFDMN